MTVAMKCEGCGRFVRYDDQSVEWDTEYGDYGSVLSSWPTSCAHCRKRDRAPAATPPKETSE